MPGKTDSSQVIDFAYHSFFGGAKFGPIGSLYSREAALPLTLPCMLRIPDESMPLARAGWSRLALEKTGIRISWLMGQKSGMRNERG